MDRKTIGFLISALLLYLSGVATGVFLSGYASRSLIFPLQTKTTILSQELDRLETELEGIRDETFLLLYSPDNNFGCALSTKLLAPTLQEIQNLINILPDRLETANVSKDILDRYSSLNVRAWIIANYLHKKCDLSPVPVLYIFNHNEASLQQGEELDRAKKEKNMIVFVAYAGARNPLVQALAERNAPILVICEKKIVGPVPAEKILEEVRGC